MLQKSTFQGFKMKNCRMQTTGLHQGCERARSPRPRCPGQALMPPSVSLVSLAAAITSALPPPAAGGKDWDTIRPTASPSS